MVMAVAHQALLSKPNAAYVGQMKLGECFIEVKAQFDAAQFSAADFNVWRL